MIKQHLVLAAALAVVAVVAVALGAPVTTVLLVAVLLACPLMMLFMMGGMGHGSQNENEGHERDKRTGVS